MLKGHILDLEREKFAEALTVIEYLTGGERMYMDLYDRAVAECNDRIAELRQPAYEFVDIKAVDIRLFMLQTEQKLGAVAELELRVLVNVFPSQIETVLMNKGYAANYQIIVDRVNNSDTIEVQVEMTPEMFSDSMSEVTAKEKELVTALKAMLGIYAKVTLVNPKTITRSEGKALRVIDKRNLYK